MGTIDIDRAVLRTSAAWGRLAAEQVRRHVTSEYGDDVPASRFIARIGHGTDAA
jgi:hypothetical protein